MNPSKIFGIGLSRTGTQTLAAALNTLGCKTRWFPCDTITYVELFSGHFELTTLQEYDALTDTPVVPYYPQFDELYPGSKFILTTRSKESWLASVERHWTKHRFQGPEAPTAPFWRHFGSFVNCCVYGCHGYDRNRFSYVFDAHQENVERYFAGRPADLLVMNICDGQGWDVLCPFLGKEPPTEPFPRVDAFQSSNS